MLPCGAEELTDAMGGGREGQPEKGEWEDSKVCVSGGGRAREAAEAEREARVEDGF